MTLAAITTVNGDILILAALLVGFTFVQAILFMRHALKFNNKHQLFTKDEIKSAIKSSAVISVGPSMSVMVVVLSLIPLMGPVVTFMRCGVIGAADFELINAKLAVGPWVSPSMTPISPPLPSPWLSLAAPWPVPPTSCT